MAFNLACLRHRLRGGNDLDLQLRDDARVQLDRHDVVAQGLERIAQLQLAAMYETTP